MSRASHARSAARPDEPRLPRVVVPRPAALMVPVECVVAGGGLLGAGKGSMRSMRVGDGYGAGGARATEGEPRQRPAAGGRFL